MHGSPVISMRHWTRARLSNGRSSRGAPTERNGGNPVDQHGHGTDHGIQLREAGFDRPRRCLHPSKRISANRSAAFSALSKAGASWSNPQRQLCGLCRRLQWRGTSRGIRQFDSRYVATFRNCARRYRAHWRPHTVSDRSASNGGRRPNATRGDTDAAFAHARRAAGGSRSCPLRDVAQTHRTGFPAQRSDVPTRAHRLYEPILDNSMDVRHPAWRRHRRFRGGPLWVSREISWPPASLPG